MIRKQIVILAGAALVALAGSALATPVIGSVVAETARGTLAEPLDLREKFDPQTGVMLKSKGDIEIITQRIEATPGSSFGWHSHPGAHVNVVLEGTITLYYGKDCTTAVSYGPGESFAIDANRIHLAHNEGDEKLVLFATYFAPKGDPPLPVRVDQPLPEPGCPE
jgi:quercetin dioxygenase-like cupin family protein